MALEQFRQLGRHPGVQVLETFALRDTKIGQVCEALLQFLGVLGHNFLEAQAFPDAEVDFPKLRNGLYGEAPPLFDDFGPPPGAGQVRGVDPGQLDILEMVRQGLALADPGGT